MRTVLADGRGGICVLGMSRTGTSLTARALELCGVFLGRGEELLGKDLHQLDGERADVRQRARAANPEGFWEHYRLMRLNERILGRLGGSWREPPAMPPGWESDPDLDALRDEARELLEASFAGRDRWGWKDPRNSLTLPFWQRLLPELRYVVCLRNPVDVAASLHDRDGMRAEQALSLWATYVRAMLASTHDRPRLLVSYEDYFANPRATAERLALFAGTVAAGSDAPARVEEAVASELWRHRTTPAEVLADERLPADVAETYLATELLSAAAAVAPSADARAAELHAAVDAYVARGSTR